MKSAARREWGEIMTLEDACWSLVWEFGFSLKRHGEGPHMKRKGGFCPAPTCVLLMGDLPKK